jgi:CheY-like chemotaxis protein
VKETAAGKVLLVDSEESVLQLELEILRASGVSVRTARSGSEAIELLNEESIDAVVSDLDMSGEVTAAGLFHWITENRPELATRVVFTVSNARDGEASEALRRSGRPVVSKPFAIEAFWDAVKKVLSAEVPASLKH